MIVDGGFLAANLAKVLDGGYVPLLLAIAVYGVMWIWHRGVAAVHEADRADQSRLEPFMAQIAGGKYRAGARLGSVPDPLERGYAAGLSWHVRKNRSLHEHVLALTLTVMSTPRVDQHDRVTVTRERARFLARRSQLRLHGAPDVPAILARCKPKGADIDLDDITYYVGHETIVPREDGKGLPRWQVALFAFMARNAARLSDFSAAVRSRGRDRAGDRDMSPVAAPLPARRAWRPPELRPILLC